MSCSSAEVEQRVALVVVDLAGEPVGGGLGGHGVQAEALGRRVPAGGALEEVEDLGRACASGSTPAGVEQLDGARERWRSCPRGGGQRLAMRSTAIDQRDVGLDRRDDVAGRRCGPRARAAARGCATRPAPGSPRAPRRRRSAAGRGPRCGRPTGPAARGGCLGRLSRCAMVVVRAVRWHGRHPRLSAALDERLSMRQAPVRSARAARRRSARASRRGRARPRTRRSPARRCCR